MDIPYEGKVSARLVQKRFKNKIFYYIHNPQQGLPYTIKCGFLKFAINSFEHPMITFFDDDWALSGFSQHVSWDNIFESYEDAEKDLKELNNLYEVGFYKRPFIRPEKLKVSKGIMIRIEQSLGVLFEGDPRFKGVSFSDVGASGIQVYCCGHHTTLLYDLSNHIEVLTSFIKFKKEGENHGKIN